MYDESLKNFAIFLKIFKRGKNYNLARHFRPNLVQQLRLEQK
jgi:hypothetical protein